MRLMSWRALSISPYLCPGGDERHALLQRPPMLGVAVGVAEAVPPRVRQRPQPVQQPVSGPRPRAKGSSLTYACLDR
jgi:hypothetical protein